MPSLASAIISGIYSALPATGAGVGTAGRLYFGTDTGQILRDSGTAWVDVSPYLNADSLAAIQEQMYTFAVDTGAANAYVISLANKIPLVAGSRIDFQASAANTGASTIEVTVGPGVSVVVPIKKQGTAALSGGEIAAGQIIRLVYDGTNLQM